MDGNFAKRLQPGSIGSKGRHDDPRVDFVDHPHQVPAHLAFRSGGLVIENIGRIADHGENPFITDFLQFFGR